MTVLIVLQRSLGAVEEHQRMRNYLLRIEREGVQKVKMFVVITAAYVIFWGPLFFVTLIQHPLSSNHSDYEVMTVDIILKYIVMDKRVRHKIFIYY